MVAPGGCEDREATPLRKLVLTATQARDPAYLEKILSGLEPWWCSSCEDLYWFRPDMEPLHIHAKLKVVDWDDHSSRISVEGFIRAPFFP